jgi:hypothetical protein
MFLKVRAAMVAEGFRPAGTRGVNEGRLIPPPIPGAGSFSARIEPVAPIRGLW